MNVNGTDRIVHTRLTADDRAGLHRTKPLTTSLSGVDVTRPERTKPLNTALESKSPARTQVSPADLNGTREKHSSLSQHEQLVKKTQTWVAQTFFGTMLKQMRESPFKSDLFSGGRGGQAFSSLFDQHLVERISNGSGAKLVDSIVGRIEARAAEVKQRITPQSERMGS